MSKYKKSKKPKKKTGFREILTNPLVLVLSGFILIAGGLFALWRAGQPSAGGLPIEVKGAPSLKVDREKVDFGNVPLDKTVTVTFQLANVGDKPLLFTQEPYVEVVEGC